jgi:hypothetical protein
MLRVTLLHSINGPLLTRAKIISLDVERRPLNGRVLEFGERTRDRGRRALGLSPTSSCSTTAALEPVWWQNRE